MDRHKPAVTIPITTIGATNSPSATNTVICGAWTGTCNKTTTVLLAILDDCMNLRMEADSICG